MSRIRLVLLAVFLALTGILAALVSIPARPEPIRADAELPPEPYEALRDRLLGVVASGDMRAAVGELRGLLSSGRIGADDCHGLAHELGHESYELHRDFGRALAFQDELCNSGYLHGVIESHFAFVKDVPKALRAVCKTYPAATFLGWQCYHGIGHGLMFYTENDLPRALDLCDMIDEARGVDSCRNGVFMENFSTDQKEHVSRYLKPDDPFYPCRDQKEERKSDCYAYAPAHYLQLNPGRYAEALAWCDGAEPGYVRICVAGVGNQAAKEQIREPARIEQACMAAGGEKAPDCLAGMIALYVYHHGAIEPARAVCEGFAPDARALCDEILRPHESLFQTVPDAPRAAP